MLGGNGCPGEKQLEQGRVCWDPGLQFLNGMVSGGLTEKMTFEHRSGEGGEVGGKTGN